MPWKKTLTLNVRVNPDVKQNAENVLKHLGVPLATAVDMFLRQIAMTGGIPFSISLPKAPDMVNADAMTAKLNLPPLLRFAIALTLISSMPMAS